MRVRHYLYDSEAGGDHVEAVLHQLADRDESVALQDVAAADDRDDAIREAMLTLRDAVRIGSNPDEIYDEDGRPDFSPGVLITEEPTGRRNLHIGSEALAVLEADDDSN